jgi:uncharacterized protein YybS (DUF2232 family)
MEHFTPQANGAKDRAWLTLLLSVAAGVVTIFIPAGLLLLPALWAYAGARTKRAWVALPAAVYALLAFLLYSWEAALGLAVSAAAAAAALCYTQTRRVSNTYTALALSGFFLAGLYCAVCLPGILSGAGAFAEAQAAIDSVLALYRETAQQLAGASAESLALVNEYLSAFSESVPANTVSALCICSGVLGLSNVLFYHLFCRKCKTVTVAPMREFRYWTMPRSMILGLFAIMIGSYVLDWAGWTFADGMVSTVNALVGMPLLLQGLCVVDFMLARSQKNVTTGRVLTYVLIGVLFGILQMPLIMIGCFELIFRFRDRIRNVPPKSAV